MWGEIIHVGKNKVANGHKLFLVPSVAVVRVGIWEEESEEEEAERGGLWVCVCVCVGGGGGGVPRSTVNGP